MKLGEGTSESTEECYQHLIKCVHQAAKEALGEKILRSKTKPFYYWNEEIGQLVKEKREKYLQYISPKDPQARIELKRMQGKVKKNDNRREEQKLGKDMFYSRKLLGW